MGTTETRIIFCGAGRVVREVTRLVRARPGFRIVAAYSRNPNVTGEDIGVLAGGSPIGTSIVADRSTALRVAADIMVIATTSFLREVAEDIKSAIEHDLNVVCTAEEMAFPWLADKLIADEIDQMARHHKVTVLGCGVNPGFLSDALVLTAASAAWNVEHIAFKRCVNLSRFSATILRRLGIGFSKQDFEAGTQAGTIFGHIGFPQSMHLVGNALQVKIEKIVKRFEPLIAGREYELENSVVSKGTTAGFRQYVTAVVDGKPWFDAEFFGHVDPDSVGAILEDSIDIDGYAPVHLALNPALRAQPTVAALVANSLRRVAEGPPGLVTVADLRPARPSPTVLSQLVPNV